MNNLHRVQNVFIGDGSAFPANNAALTSLTAGKVGVYGSDWLALNPNGADTISTQPGIFIVESKTDSDGVGYVKKSNKIVGASVISVKGAPYVPARREVWSIGHSRKTATGTITVANSTVYGFSIRFKNDKQNYSVRPEMLSINFTSAAAATQLTIATQIAGAINSSAWRSEVIAIVVGDGTGVYGVTGATDYGVEITAKDVNQYLSQTYTLNQVYFSCHVDDSTGFGTGTTCTQIQAFDPGNGTYNQVYAMENKAFATEGVTNRTMWPISVLDYSASVTLVNSAVLGINQSGTTGEDEVTYASTIAAIINPGEKVEIDGVNYEVKYIKGTGAGTTGGNEVVLTTVLTTTTAATDATKIRVKYDLTTIEFNDTINTAVGFAVSNKSVVIATPALDSGDAYNGVSAASQDVMDVINGWMATTPLAPAAIVI